MQSVIIADPMMQTGPAFMQPVMQPPVTVIEAQPPPAVYQQVMQPPVTVIQSAPAPVIQPIMQPPVTVIQSPPAPVIQPIMQPPVTVIQSPPAPVIQPIMQPPVTVIQSPPAPVIQTVTPSIVVNSVATVVSPTVHPAPMKCTYCKQDITTVTQRVPGPIIWILFTTLFLFLIWPFCLIPFCVPSCYDVQHRCPVCRRILHVHKRM